MKIDMSKLEKVKKQSDVELEIQFNTAKKYLNDTDWYVIRKLETNTPVPSDVLALRESSRQTIAKFKNN